MPLVTSTPGADVLADVVDLLKLRGRIFCRCELSSPWALGFASGDFSHFHVIERGACWLRLQGQADAIALDEGDLLLVTRGHAYQLSDEPRTPPIPLDDLLDGSEGGLRAVLRHGGGGRETQVICGSFEFGGAQATSLLTVLPDWIRVQRADRRGNEWLDATVRFLERETRQSDPGAGAIVARLIEVMFVEAIRTWLKDQPPGSAGWLGALQDPSIGRTLALIHQAPQTAWTVPALAAQVGMSRSPFAAKFTALVGQAPMQYLMRWRMHVGAELLRQGGAPVASVAERVGYESAAAFSRVFTRQFGVSPGLFRRSGGRATGHTTGAGKGAQRRRPRARSAKRGRPRQAKQKSRSRSNRAMKR